jgi:hypothetical protein
MKELEHGKTRKKAGEAGKRARTPERPPLVDSRFIHVTGERLTDTADPDATILRITGLDSDLKKAFVGFKARINTGHPDMKAYDSDSAGRMTYSDEKREVIASIEVNRDGDRYLVADLVCKRDLPEAYIQIFCANDGVRDAVLASLVPVIGRVTVHPAPERE